MRLPTLAALAAVALSTPTARADTPAHPCDAITSDEVVRLFSKTVDAGKRSEPAPGRLRCEWTVLSGGSGSIAFEFLVNGAQAKYDALKAESGAEVISRLPGTPVWIGARREYAFLAGDKLATIHFPDVYLPKGLGEQFLKLVRPRITGDAKP